MMAVESRCEQGTDQMAFARVTFDADVMGGQACIRGLRLPVATVVKLVAAGMTVDDIVKEYPALEPEDVKEALEYAAWTTEERVIPTKSA